LSLDSFHREFWYARLGTHLSGLFDAAGYESTREPIAAWWAQYRSKV